MSETIVHEMSMTRSTHLTRRQRAARREYRVQMIVGSALILGVCLLLFNIPPGSSDRPAMTIYMAEECAECRKWVEHVAGRGFRVIMGDPSELMSVQARISVPLGRRAPVVAVLDEHVVEGFVPAREIHLLVNGRLGKSIKGLVVPGVPSGVPDITRGRPAPYTVYALYDGGLLRPIKTYNDSMHQHASYLPR